MRENFNTPFAAVTDIMHLAGRTSTVDDFKADFTWQLDAHGQPDYKCLHIHGTKVSIDVLRAGVHSLLVHLKAQLASHVLLGLQPIKNCFSNIKDDYQNANEGYSFLDDKRNSHLFPLDELKCFIESNEELSKQFLDPLDRERMNLSRLRQWVDTTEDFLGSLLALIHLTSGQPGRAPELSTLLFRNRPNASRNLFVMYETLVFIPSYNKTRSVKGTDTYVPRFLATEVSAILLQFLVTVRPFLVYVHSLLISSYAIYLIHDADSSKLYNAYLYVRQGKRMDIDQIRYNFNAANLQFLNLDIGMADFRHIIQAFTEKHLIKYVPSVTSELQAGHSVETGQTMYARSTQDCPGINRQGLVSFRLMSIQWQHLLSLSQNVSSVSSQSSGNPFVGIRNENHLIDISPLQGKF